MKKLFPFGLLMLIGAGQVAAFVAPQGNTSPLSLLQESQGPPGYPNAIIYPKRGWGLSKPEPKSSLLANGTAGSAKKWILNLIEFAHWFSFPIGFALFWKLFSNSNALGKAIRPGNPTAGIFFLLMAHVCQVFGGGISGNMMHQYEGWQVTVFRNPLKPYTGSDGAVQGEPGYNDAWLRAVAYQMLFSFQTLGVLFTWIGVHGFKNQAHQFLTVATGLVLSLAPQLPHCTSVFPKIAGVFQPIKKIWDKITCGNRPVFPLSIYLFVVFLINSIVATKAYQSMFGVINWAGVPILEHLPGSISSIIPFVLIAFGGIFEGLRAETTFNQWDHFLAFVMLDTGLALHIPYYMRLIGGF